ncbi:MAG: transporter [Alphaproteobacteria bacterium]
MSLSLTQILQLCSFAVLLACGQILFKLSASTLPPLASVNGLMALAANLWFWAAMVLYGTATLLWILILQQVPLSSAYPFAALGFVLVPAASYFLFKEPLNLFYALGVVLIISGLGVIMTLASK